MRIVVTGGTGFIGRKVVATLVERGDEVVVLTRDPSRSKLPERARAAAWTPEVAGPWSEVVDGAQAIVHLAGEPVMGRWTDEKKRRIRDSRVLSTRAVVTAIERARQRPRVLVSASAIGFYGSHAPDEELDESSPAGSDFLAEVAKAWEAEAERAEALGCRVARVRIGIVFGDDGGALTQMARPFRFFAGGPIGSGEQIVSWIHVSDVVRLLLFALDDDRVRGPLNATAPSPASMRDVARSIGRALRRPAALRTPSFAVRAVLGEAADAVLSGQRVLPRVAQQLGFSFEHPDLDEAVAVSLR